MRYALLLLPAANRVYADSSTTLGVAEVEALLGVEASLETIAGIRYIGFDADDTDLHSVSRLSVTYALFERAGDALHPVELPSTEVYDSDLLTTQRYTGKTNEHFTKLLVNLTVGAPRDDMTILDPLAGRGTTLNQAVAYGWNAVGVEIDQKDCDAYATFFTTWLKNKRLPHKARKDKGRFTVEFAPDRASLDDGRGQTTTMINGDTRHLDTFLKQNSVDAIVADLPYGVRHGSHRSETSRERSAIDLVGESLDAWTKVLRPHGAIGVAFNTHTCRRAALLEVFDGGGYEVFDDGPHARLAHRVDQAINRDVLIARPRSASTARVS